MKGVETEIGVPDTNQDPCSITFEFQTTNEEAFMARMTVTLHEQNCLAALPRKPVHGPWRLANAQ